MGLKPSHAAKHAERKNNTNKTETQPEDNYGSHLCYRYRRCMHFRPRVSIYRRHARTNSVARNSRPKNRPARERGACPPYIFWIALNGDIIELLGTLRASQSWVQGSCGNVFRTLPALLVPPKLARFGGLFLPTQVAGSSSVRRTGPWPVTAGSS